MSQTMENLLKKYTISIPVLRRGDLVEGEILVLTATEALVDIGSKAEGILPLSEFEEEMPKVGNRILVYVLTTESRKGQILLSYKKALAIKLWLDLEKAIEKDKTLVAEVIGHNKGGLIVDIWGLQGFIPFSHLESGPDSALARSELQSQLDRMRGEKIKVKVVEVNKDKNRIILSERKAKDEEELKNKQKALARLKQGETISAIILKVMPYGLILDLDGVTGVIPKEEISWEEELTLSKFEGGQKIKAKILEIEKERGRVILSIRKLKPDPWEQKVKKTKTKKKLEGEVSKITSLGVWVRLARDVEGLLPLAELPHEKQDLKVGEKLKVKLKNINVEEHKVDLEIG